ncbi:MAG: outer-membrane lipoprotein carrier protein LolA [Pseudomonadota bacterium]
MKRTPLNLILDRTVDLSRSGMVVAHNEDGPTTYVVAQDPERPEIGSIKLVFTNAPVELRQWVITDDTGTKTTIILGAQEKGIRLRPSQFNIVQETEKRLR